MSTIIQTKAGAAYAAFPGASARFCLLSNPSATSLSFLVGSTTHVLAAAAEKMIEVTALTSEISVKRTDEGEAQVDALVRFGFSADADVEDLHRAMSWEKEFARLRENLTEMGATSLASVGVSLASVPVAFEDGTIRHVKLTELAAAVAAINA